MKKKIVMIAAIALCSLLLFTACGSKSPISLTQAEELYKEKGFITNVAGNVITATAIGGNYGAVTVTVTEYESVDAAKKAHKAQSTSSLFGIGTAKAIRGKLVAVATGAGNVKNAAKLLNT